jgi:hypothetical protein
VKSRTPGDLPRGDVCDDKLHLQHQITELQELKSSQRIKIITNQRTESIKIITNQRTESIKIIINQRTESIKIITNHRSKT